MWVLLSIEISDKIVLETKEAMITLIILMIYQKFYSTIHFS